MSATHSIRLTETQRVTCVIRKRRGQSRMMLRVSGDGVVTLTVPWWVPYAQALEFVMSKREWLMQALDRSMHFARPGISGGSGCVECDRSVLQREHYERFKESARMLVRDRLEDLNRQYGFTWGRVAIRMNSSRWGSCSSKGNLNFDYRIVFLPPHLRDYLVVHELCHLEEMNHSERFWALVARAVPEWMACRKELRGVRRSVECSHGTVTT